MQTLLPWAIKALLASVVWAAQHSNIVTTNGTILGQDFLVAGQMGEDGRRGQEICLESVIIILFGSSNITQFTLKCSFHYHCLPIITQDSSTQLIFSDHLILQIPKVSGDEVDTYKCYASNEYGKAVCTVILNVIEGIRHVCVLTFITNFLFYPYKR